MATLKLPVAVGLLSALLFAGVAAPAAAEETFSAILDRAVSAIETAVNTLQDLIDGDAVPDEGQAGLETAQDGMQNRDAGLAEASEHLVEVELPAEIPEV